MLVFFGYCLQLFNDIYSAATELAYFGFITVVAGLLVSFAGFRYLLSRAKK